ENTFTVDAPVEKAWALLTDIPEIAPCLPGAKLEGEDDGVYSGSVKVKVGPVTAEYKGTAEFVERDDAAHRAVISGKGRDSRGAGNAQALITAQMTGAGSQTTVDIHTDLKITGKVAQFGRGVMQDVSEKLLGQFAECLAGKLSDEPSVEEIADAGAAMSTAAGPSDAGAPSAEAKPGDTDDDALDLLDMAGGAMAKRLVPAAIAAAVLIILLSILGRRRRSTIIEL
ncbi:MAG: SRPBCC family protein, partial [Acidimicrobiia bacterium]|nr:SRPBCC family protein [Acidimicrobiia bacterium]